MYKKKREDYKDKSRAVKYTSWFRKQVRENPLFGTHIKELSEKGELKGYLYNEFNNIQDLWQLVQLRRYISRERGKQPNSYVYHLKFTNLMNKDSISRWTYNLLKRVPKAIEIIGERLKIFHDSYEVMSEYIFSNLAEYLTTPEGEIYKKYNLVVQKGTIKIGLVHSRRKLSVIKEEDIVYKDLEQLSPATNEELQ